MIFIGFKLFDSTQVEYFEGKNFPIKCCVFKWNKFKQFLKFSINSNSYLCLKKLWLISFAGYYL